MGITITGSSHVDPSSAGGGGGAYSYAVNPYGTYGAYRPSAVSVGLPAGVAQSQLAVRTGNSSGDFVITAGGVYDLMSFQARVVIKTAAQVIFTRCMFFGKPVQSGAVGLIDCNLNPGTNYNVRVYDSVLSPAAPSIWQNGLVGHDFIVERCNIFNVNDGVQLGSSLSGSNANGILRGNWIHNLAFFSPQATSATAERATTHNDCVQWMGGANFTSKGNRFDGLMNPSIGAAQLDQAHRDPISGGGPNNSAAVAGDAYGYNPIYPSLTTNSCFEITSGTAPCSGWNSDSDWFAGGGFSIHADTNLGGSCTNAKFARSFQYGPICAPAPGVTATVTTDFSGAVYTDTGLPVPSSAIFRGP